ncbi:MAG: hypothetical protein V1799_00250 [bacterium]
MRIEQFRKPTRSILAQTVLFGLLIFLQICQASETRVRSMGAFKFSLRDPDRGFNLYDFGKNPAWLYQDEQVSWLRISPAFTTQSGDYHRLFDPGDVDRYSAAFDGVKVQGEKGTFRGYTSYDVEYRNNVYRSLESDPYFGDAFFFCDTTTGNFRYNGPKVGFQYSLELFPSFYAGAGLTYQILDGLKSIYTRPKTLYRGVEGTVGIAYQVDENLALGLSITPSDIQERIESQSEDLLDVETYKFRGEKYSTRYRGSTSSYKIHHEGFDVSSQLQWALEMKAELAARAGYNFNQTTILVPQGLLKEVEEGYAPKGFWYAEIISHYPASEEIDLSASVSYNSIKSWSKNSVYDLRLWEWDAQELSLGMGASYRLSPKTLFALEYEFGSWSADSSKYIDARFSSWNMKCHTLRTGGEAELLPKIQVRLGCQLQMADKDLIFGKDEFFGYRVSAGLGIGVIQDVTIDVLVEYGKVAPGRSSLLGRSSFDAAILVTLLSF